MSRGPRRPGRHRLAVISDWRSGLPVLTGNAVTLRELRASDAPALFAALSSDQVSRFISPPPATLEGFGRFINWAIRQRECGQYVCFAVVPHGSDTAIGIFQVRSLEPAFGTAEWGFALASEFWGSGIFVDGARLLIDFAFEHARRPSSRGACGLEKWARKRRPPEARRGAGRRAAAIVPQERRVSGSGSVDDSAG